MKRPPRTTLLTLCALTLAAALAPAHAMAVANNPSAGECRAPGAGDTVVLIGGQLCAANQGSGGNAGTGTGALPGGRQPGETIWVTGEIPECLRNSARCLPGQIGGGGLEIRDGGGRGGGPGRRSGPGPAGKKAEATKGKRAEEPEKLTKEECLKLRGEIGIWRPPGDLDRKRHHQAVLGRILESLYTQLHEGVDSKTLTSENAILLRGTIGQVIAEREVLEGYFRSAVDERERWRARLEAWEGKCEPVLKAR